MSNNTTALRQAGVDLNGLMSVLSRHLYSTPTVALRELVQNAHDSIVRRRLEQPSWDKPSRISIIPDAKRQQLRIIDTGAGLTEEEIHKYLATVGVGYTRQLRQKDGSESGQDQTGLIGMFGLGFLSAFVLAKRVVVSTTSYQSPNLGCRYVSTDAEHYAVSHIDPRPVGTEVLLELNDEFYELLDAKHLRKVLSHYCALLIEPIYVFDSLESFNQIDLENDRESNLKTDTTERNPSAIAINPEPPPWRRTDHQTLHPAAARKQALAFASRFEKNFEPICTIAVHPQSDSDAQGLLWIQDGGTYGSSDNRNLSVFLRGMLLDDDARDLLPHWAGFVGGVIESQQLTPTASREDLQRDQQFDHTRFALSEALITGLSSLAKEQPEAWRRVLRRHNEALLGAALCDDRLFLLLMDSLHVPTSQGDLLAEQLVSKGAVHVVLDNSAGFEDMLFRALGIPVAQGNRYAVVPFLRRWVEIKGLRLIELGTQSGNRQLFKTKALSEHQRQWLQQHLCHDEKLIAASFAPASLPLIVVADREQALKKRLAEDNKDKKISLAALSLARHFTDQIEEGEPAKLYLNIDNAAVLDLLATIEHDSEAALTAVTLLRAFKTLLIGPSGSEHNTERLQQALADLASSIGHLLPTPPDG
ncbi:MAG: ATP-binding protein, partial [Psychrobacter sp.]|nr:ATP-binding protein [Psychrobacter sp.]